MLIGGRCDRPQTQYLGVQNAFPSTPNRHAKMEPTRVFPHVMAPFLTTNVHQFFNPSLGHSLLHMPYLPTLDQTTNSHITVAHLHQHTYIFETLPRCLTQRPKSPPQAFADARNDQHTMRIVAQCPNQNTPPQRKLKPASIPWVAVPKRLQPHRSHMRINRFEQINPKGPYS